MTIFVRSTEASKPATRLAFYAGQLGAAILTTVAVAQLFTFEDYPEVLAAYPLVGGLATATVLAATLTTAEVLAVPHLLYMRLSPLMRRLSLICGWLVCLAWLGLGTYLVLHEYLAVNGGLLGATVAVHGGSPAVLFGVVLAAILLTSGSISLRKPTSHQ